MTAPAQTPCSEPSRLLSVPSPQPAMLPQRVTSPDPACLTLASAAGVPLGRWPWCRVPGEDAAAAVFVPGAFEPAPDCPALSGLFDEDACALSSVRLIARGTPPRGGEAMAPFEIEHDVAARVVAVGSRVLPVGERLRIAPGDELQLGLLVLGFAAPEAVAVPEPWVGSTETGARIEGTSIGGLCVGDLRIEDAQAAAAPALAGAGDPVFDPLLAAYQAWLLDPSVLGAQASHALPFVGRGTGVVAPDPLAGWIDPAKAHDSLHALLAAPGSMDALIERVDALGVGDLLAAPEVPSVLHLFAPQRVGARPAALASLTRREHHAPAADSALRVSHALMGERDREGAA